MAWRGMLLVGSSFSYSYHANETRRPAEKKHTHYPRRLSRTSTSEIGNTRRPGGGVSPTAVAGTVVKSPITRRPGPRPPPRPPHRPLSQFTAFATRHVIIDGRTRRGLTFLDFEFPASLCAEGRGGGGGGTDLRRRNFCEISSAQLWRPPRVVHVRINSMPSCRLGSRWVFE